MFILNNFHFAYEFQWLKCCSMTGCNVTFCIIYLLCMYVFAKVVFCSMGHSYRIRAELYHDNDHMLQAPLPSNPWISEDTGFWDLCEWVSARTSWKQLHTYTDMNIIISMHTHANYRSVLISCFTLPTIKFSSVTLLIEDKKCNFCCILKCKTKKVLLHFCVLSLYLHCN